jgi:hypothetical protein
MTSKMTNQRFSGLLTDTAHAEVERLEAELPVLILSASLSREPARHISADYLPKLLTR